MLRLGFGCVLSEAVGGVVGSVKGVRSVQSVQNAQSVQRTAGHREPNDVPHNPTTDTLIRSAMMRTVSKKALTRGEDLDRR